MIAIIIPYFKLTFFEVTLQALASQTDKRFKVYIGDDASPEDCSPLLKKFEGQFNFVYHRFETNLGGTSLTKQWERCIALSKDEEWFMILGDDDVLSSNLMASFYENYIHFSQSNSTVVRFSSQVVDQDNKALSDVYRHPSTEKAADFICRKFSRQTRSSLSEYVFRTDVLQKKEFRDFELAWHSDDMAVLEFSDFGVIYSINEATTYVRVSDLNITGNKNLDVQKNNATFQFCDLLYNEYWNVFTVLQRKILIEKAFMAFLNVSTFKNYLKLCKYSWVNEGSKAIIYIHIRFMKIYVARFLKRVGLFNLIKKNFNRIEIYG